MGSASSDDDQWMVKHNTREDDSVSENGEKEGSAVGEIKRLGPSIEAIRSRGYRVTRKKTVE